MNFEKIVEFVWGKILYLGGVAKTLSPLTGLILIIAAIILAPAIIYLLGYSRAKNKFRTELSHYQRNNLVKEWKSIVLVSHNGGRTWHEKRTHQGGSVLMPINDASLEFYGLNDFMVYVRKNGPLTFQGKRAKKDWAIIKKAGIKAMP